MKILYLDVLNRKKFKYNFVRSKRKEYLPTLLSKNEILLRLNNIPNLKHKAICSLLYGCVIRLNELINFKIEHILKGQNLIKIVQGY
jgi:site-specific recombinase XerD